MPRPFDQDLSDLDKISDKSVNRAASTPGGDAGAAADNSHVAVVDLGSNSIRLVVYDELSRAPFPRFNEKSLCRLGASVDEDGNLGDDAMDCVARALERFSAIAAAMDVSKIELLATEAIRKATNGDEFRARLEAASGLELRVLTGDEEARLAAMGVIAGFYKPEGLAGDLGGGSLELAMIRDGGVSPTTLSLPLGALLIQQRIESEGKGARDHIDKVILDALPQVVTGGNFYIVGGGWRALAKVYMANEYHAVPVIHGLTLEADELRDLAKTIWRMDADDLEKLDGVPGRRLATIPAAAMVMDRVLKHLKPDRVIFSALGVREGWLHDQLSDADRASDPLITGCRHLADESARVPRFAAALERWTDGLFIGEAQAQKRLRLAVITLSDIAWRESSDVRAKHAFERILRFPFIGITHYERVFLASAVHSRYGKAADDESLELLSDEDVSRAHVLGTAILLGYRFSGSVPDILDQAAIRVDADTVTLEVDNHAHVPDSDAVQSRLSLLAKALGRDRTAVIERQADH